MEEIDTETIRNSEFSEEIIINCLDEKYRLRFPGRLESQYKKSDWVIRKQRYLLLGVCAVIFYNLYLVNDWMMLPDVFGTAMLLRLCVVTPLLLIFIFLILLNTRLWVLNFLIDLIFYVAGSGIIWLVVLTNNDNAAHYYTGIILIIFFSSILLRLPFWHSLVVSVSILITYSLALLYVDQFSIEVCFNSTVVLISAIIICMMGNYQLEKDSRRNFLLSMLQKINREKLIVANRKLEELSVSDELTGLANRRYFNKCINNEWHVAIRQNTPVSIIFIDIDFFKNFNDNYGHQAGDNCLQRVAETISMAARRPHDLAVRYGGEEFLILLPMINLESASAVAEIIRVEIEQLKIEHEYSGASKYVTASLGVSSCIPEKGDGYKSLLEQADIALYMAKSAGRNQVRVYSREKQDYLKNLK